MRRPTRFFRGTEGWGESDLEEMVEGLELAFHDRGRDMYKSPHASARFWQYPMAAWR